MHLNSLKTSGMLDINPTLTGSFKDVSVEEKDSENQPIFSDGLRFPSDLNQEEKEDKSLEFNKEAIVEEQQIRIPMASLNQLGVISVERWKKNLSFPAIVKDIRTKEVVCEVAVDVDSHTFQKRIFEKHLFEDIAELAVNSLILVKIKSKPGALRLEILDGKGIIDDSIFTIKEGIEDLLNSDVNQKIEGEINL